jgi:hypothetical protein
MILMATSTEGTYQVAGLDYSCGINLECAEEDCLEELYNLGASAVTQFLAHATGDPNYFLIRDKPPKF